MLDQKTRTVPPSTAAKKKPSRWPIVAIVVLAIGVIGMSIWAFSEQSHAHDLSADLSAAEAEVATLESELAQAGGVVVVGGQGLTERQQQMVDLIEGPWIDWWTRADGDAVAAFYKEDAEMYDIEGGEVLTPTDGTLQQFASRWPGIQLRPGMLVHGDRAMFVLAYGGIDVGGILEFTDSGELLIESSAAYNSVLGPRH